MLVNALPRPEVEGAAADDLENGESIGQVVGGAELPDLTYKPGGDGKAESLLPIISSQRERFRRRVKELEEENHIKQQNVEMQQSEIEKMRADNVHLYEKIKFLQSYSSSKAVSRSDDTEAKYSSQYEAGLDPFRRFNISERQRTYMALSTHDKATLSIGRVIMGNSRARAVFFFYLVILHLLVFTVLYRLAYTESCKRQEFTDCAAKFKEHMQMVHGDNDHGH